VLQKSPFAFFFQLIWLEFPKRTLLLSGLSVLAMGLVSLEPLLLRELIAELEQGHRDPHAAGLLFGAIVGVWFLALGVNRCRDFVELRTSPELRLKAQMRLYQWIDQHNAEFFRSHHSANLGQKVKQAGTAVLALIDIIFDHQIRLVTALAMAIWTLGSVPSYFLLTLLAWLAFFLPLAWWFARRVLPLSQGFGEAASQSSGLLGDILSNMRTVQTFNQVAGERLRFQQSLEAEKAASYRVRWFLILMNTGLYGAQIVFQAVFVGLAVYAHVHGVIGTPELVMVTSLSAILLASVWGVTQHLQGFYDQSGLLKAALTTIAQPHAIADENHTPALNCHSGQIVFRSLCFSYGPRTVFDDLNLQIEPQEKVGLVGPSGAGKSTLFKLLQREFDPNQGSVLIDG
jgi:ATP-binding cassette subfamily B protein